jgi:hypothetical protein
VYQHHRVFRSETIRNTVVASDRPTRSQNNMKRTGQEHSVAKYIESEKTRNVGFAAHQVFVVVWGPSSDDTMLIVFQKTKQKEDWFQRDDVRRQ